MSSRPRSPASGDAVASTTIRRRATASRALSHARHRQPPNAAADLVSEALAIRRVRGSRRARPTACARRQSPRGGCAPARRLPMIASTRASRARQVLRRHGRDRRRPRLGDVAAVHDGDAARRSRGRAGRWSPDATAGRARDCCRTPSRAWRPPPADRSAHAGITPKKALGARPRAPCAPAASRARRRTPRARCSIAFNEVRHGQHGADVGFGQQREGIASRAASGRWTRIALCHPRTAIPRLIHAFAPSTPTLPVSRFG